MTTHSSIWSRFDGCWRAALTQREWTNRFAGPMPAAFQRWLVPGPRARYVPCIHAAGCRRPHRAKRDRDGQWHAIPEARDCETFEIAESDTDTLRLDLARMARDLAAAVSLDPTPPEALRGQPHVLRIGRLGNAGLPCYLTFSRSPADLSTTCDIIAAHHAGGNLVLTTTEAHATEDLRSTIRLRGGGLLTLPELLSVDARGELAQRVTVGERIPSLDCAPDANAPMPVLGGRAQFEHGNAWPHARPENPKWSDVALAMSAHEIAISFGASQASFDYRDIDGFTDHRGGKHPNRLWRLLFGFAMEDGVLPLPSKTKDPMRVRTLADLDRLLCRFFGIQKSFFDRDVAQGAIRTRCRIRQKF